MKLLDNLTCALSYAYGLPKRIIIDKHSNSTILTDVYSNEELRVARYCAYLRQYLLTTRNVITYTKYQECKKQENYSMKDEAILSEAIIYVVEKNIVDTYNRSKSKQFEQLNKTFLTAFESYLENEFIKNNYHFKINYLLSIVNLQVPANKIEALCKNFSGKNFDNTKVYPYSRILNINNHKFEKLDEHTRNSFSSIYNNDKTLLNFIYQLNDDYFETSSLEKVEINEEVEQISFKDFMESNESKTLFVDCENSNYYKVLALCKSRQYAKQINSIKLINDSHIDSSQTEWNKLQNEVNVPIEYITVNRIIADKSLVDGTILLSIAKEFYQNKCNIILATSDSDFYIIGDNIPEAKVCFLYEDCKVSSNFKKLMKTKYNLIGQSIDKLSEGYSDLIIDDLLDKCITLLNLFVTEQCEPIIKSAIKSKNLYDDDGTLTSELKKKFCDLQFKIDDDKLVITHSNNSSVIKSK